MTEEQVFYEFLQNFSDTNKDGTIAREVTYNFIGPVNKIGME